MIRPPLSLLSALLPWLCLGLGPIGSPPARAAAPPSSVRSLRPLPANPAKEAMLGEAWAAWLAAESAHSGSDATAALKKLETLREDLAIGGLETFSAGLLRAADRHRRAGDPDGAVQLAETAVKLSPGLPYAHYGLARISLGVQPLGAARALWQGLQLIPEHPQTSRTLLSDLSAALLAAALATAVAVAGLFFLRRAGLLFHDINHLFPRVLSTWQTSAIVLAVVSLPLFLHAGTVPVLLTLAAAVVVYLAPVERLLLLGLISSLGAVPMAMAVWSAHGDFAGTLSDEAYQVEMGGPSARGAVERMEGRAGRNEASSTELLLLGRHALREGDYDKAMARFQEVAPARPNDARLLTCMGNALFAKGDPDGALALYRSATEVDSTLAAAFFNQGQLYQKRAEAVGQSQPGQNTSLLINAQEALAAAQRLDPSLAVRPAAPADAPANRLLVLPALSEEDWSELASDEGQIERASRVELQSRLALLGNLGAGLGRGASPYYPLAAAGALWLLALICRGLKPSRPCQRCGRAACRRCAPSLALGTTQCGECNAAFAGKGGLSAPERVRKQIEIAHRQSRTERLVTTAGFLFAGFGHLVSGRPLRGALWAFLSALGAAILIFRNGVLRVPWEPFPRELLLGVAIALLLGAYAGSLRDLFKRRA